MKTLTFSILILSISLSFIQCEKKINPHYVPHKEKQTKEINQEPEELFLGTFMELRLITPEESRYNKIVIIFKNQANEIETISLYIYDQYLYKTKYKVVIKSDFKKGDKLYYTKTPKSSRPNLTIYQHIFSNYPLTED